MSTHSHTKGRRRFLKSTGIGVLTLPMCGHFLIETAHAQDETNLDEADPTAKALQYVHESAKEGQTCLNCNLYTGDRQAAWGACTIFPGKLVNASGWCMSWVAKQG